jgi:hypothetical protein
MCHVVPKTVRTILEFVVNELEFSCWVGELCCATGPNFDVVLSLNTQFMVFRSLCQKERTGKISVYMVVPQIEIRIA